MSENRICVYPADLTIITGNSERYCRKLIRTIKSSKGKNKHQKVTYREVAEYLGLEPDMVFKSINNIPIIDLDTTG